MDNTKPKAGYGSVTFFVYLCARILNTLVYQLISVVISWQIYNLTHSAFVLGLVGLIQFAPMLIFLFPVGMAADRFNRKALILICQAASAAVFAALTAGSVGRWADEKFILLTVFVIGSINAFQNTAMQSVLPNIVAQKDFSKAAATSSSASQAAIVLGPALGGILYMFGPASAYLLATVLQAASTVIFFFIKIRRGQTRQREKITLRSLLMGISFIKSRPIVLGAISLDLFAVLFGGATALLPIYASQILKTGSIGLGLLRSAPAVGAMLVSFVLARRPLEKGVGKSLFFAVITFGAATILFAVSRFFALSFAALLILGGADVISVVVRSTLVQTETPDEMRGRVNSVNMLFIGTSNQLGEFESGVTAAIFTVVPAALIGGVGSIAVVLLWTRLFPQLFRVDHFWYGELRAKKAAEESAR